MNRARDFREWFERTNTAAELELAADVARELADFCESLGERSSVDDANALDDVRALFRVAAEKLDAIHAPADEPDDDSEPELTPAEPSPSPTVDCKTHGAQPWTGIVRCTSCPRTWTISDPKNIGPACNCGGGLRLSEVCCPLCQADPKEAAPKSAATITAAEPEAKVPSEDCHGEDLEDLEDPAEDLEAAPQ